MGRMTEDGRHEGAVVHIFADGMYGATWSGGPVATDRADGSSLKTDEWQKRSWDEVVAFRVQCTNCSTSRYPECWRGPEWTRVHTEAQQDYSQRRIYAPDRWGLNQDDEERIERDWERHIAPYVAVQPVATATEEVSRAQDQLAEVVREVRAGGASWKDIGEAAAVSPDTAEKRWTVR